MATRSASGSVPRITSQGAAKEIAQVYDLAKQYCTATTLNQDMVSAFVERVYVFEDHYEIVWKFQDVWEQITQSEFTASSKTPEVKLDAH